MGQTIQNLAKREVTNDCVFPHRFVIEAVESFHIHYKNLRLSLSKKDFIEVCKGCIQAFERWNKRGCPENQGHIELCRKQIEGNCLNEGIKINLNKNLYNEYQGKIFADGAEFAEEKYIHLKMRDIRLEMSIAELKELHYAIKEAVERLESSDSCTVLQKT